jgi:tRNA-dihydrouridine synthase C
MQGYTPPAYWRPIGEVRRSLDIPVVANGEIWTLDDLKRCQDESGCTHFMIGRGALADLQLVSECARYLGLSAAESADDPRRSREGVWGALLSELVTRSRDALESDRRTLSRVKQWLRYAHQRKTIDWFDSVKRARDTGELAAFLKERGALSTQTCSTRWAA